MGQTILLPDGTRVDESLMRGPSTADILAELVFAISGYPQGHPNANQPGLKQLLQGVQMQLDTLIRMEAHETPRQEIKRRIEKADATQNLLRQQAQDEVDERIRSDQEAKAKLTSTVAEAQDDEPTLAAVPDSPAEEEGIELGGEG